MPEFHSEPYVYLAGVGPTSALIAWGAFYFRVRSAGAWKLVDDHDLVNIHPPIVLVALFMVYGLSGYAVYAWRKMKGRPVSVIATSRDEPDEKGLHH